MYDFGVLYENPYYSPFILPRAVEYIQRTNCQAYLLADNV